MDAAKGCNFRRLNPMNKISNFIKQIKIRDAAFLAIGLLLGCLLGATSLLSGEALFSLLGVIVGAFIPSVFKNWAAKLDRKNQLRLAAIDKRLEVHQEAYTMWRELIAKVHEPREIGEYVMKCQDWWYKNCLYLSPNARESFKSAYSAAFSHLDFINSRKIILHKPNSNENELSQMNDIIIKNWQKVIDAGDIIVAGVDLPEINEDTEKYMPNLD